jgi:FMN phosphatase YigB (HAD superfamily)
MRLAFIDLDHTVMVNPFWPAVFPHFAQYVANRSPLRPSEQQVIDELMTRSSALSAQQDVRANDWDARTRECAAAFGVPFDEPVAALVERYVSSASVVDGARDMLAALRAAGWTCVAASAGFRRFQIPPLRHLGLLGCFDALRFADEVGSLKRRRAFYGAIPADITHVASIGDAYVDDCLYPAWFGFVAVWFTGVERSGQLDCDIRPFAEVERLESVPDVLRRAVASPHLRYRAPAGPACPVCGGPGDGSPRCRLCRCTRRLARA